ncbi:hypothetical protein ACOSQ3_024383 [Xanthoceras sorbifolium]
MPIVSYKIGRKIADPAYINNNKKNLDPSILRFLSLSVSPHPTQTHLPQPSTSQSSSLSSPSVFTSFVAAAAAGPFDLFAVSPRYRRSSHLSSTPPCSRSSPPSVFTSLVAVAGLLDSFAVAHRRPSSRLSSPPPIFLIRSQSLLGAAGLRVSCGT